MAKHYTKLIIEINEDITSKVTAVKGDVNSRYLDVQLFNDSVPLDLTSHTVTMSAKSHPDSNFKVPINKFIDGQITEAINGRCQFKLKTDILGQAGVIILQISVFSGEQEVLSTNPFNLYVIDSPRNDEQMEASNEFGALVVLFSEIQNALDDMHAIRDNFGTPSEESLQAGTDTFWKALEKSIKGSADLVAYDIPSKIGEETDEEPYNTVFGKLNRIIKLQLKDGEEIFREDGTFTVPEGVNQITVIACGGGGGGALNWNQSPSGGGGAACVKKTSSVTSGQKIQITIGKGGSGGVGGSSAQDANGKSGTATVVGNIVTCPPGQGGKDLNNDTGGASGGSGGGSGGNSKTDAGAGGNGKNGLYGVGGKGSLINRSGFGGGGGSYGDGGNAATIVGESGKDGGYGAGGGAGSSKLPNSYTGGKGGNGIVIIRWGAGSD